MSVKFADFISDPASCAARRRTIGAAVSPQLPCRPLELGWTEWARQPISDDDGGNIFGRR